jgi:hypothetical protein
MPAQHCGDNQLPWQWTDNPAGEPDATFSKASAGQCLHAHVPQLASHEMVRTAAATSFSVILK